MDLLLLLVLLIIVSFGLGMSCQQKRIDHLWYYHKHDTGEEGEKFRKYIGDD